MHAHGIKILDTANDHTVVGTITHHLHLKFLPSEQRFLNENLGNRREFTASLRNGFVFFPVVGNTPTGATEGISRTND